MDTLPPLRDIIKDHNLVAKKSHGQNFLFDFNILRKIVRFANVGINDTIIEIGPGPAGLTRGMFLEGHKNIHVIEKDPRFLPVLQQLKALQPTLNIIINDALQTDFTKIGNAPRHIIANLPYNISTPILTKLLQLKSAITSITVLLQQEVSQRIASTHGNKTFGRLSVLAQGLCQVNLGQIIPASAFVPQPKVTSQIVKLTPKNNDVCIKTLEHITLVAFSERRKMVRGTLLKKLPLSESELLAVNIDPSHRPEQIPVTAYIQLAYILQGRLPFGKVSLP